MIKVGSVGPTNVERVLLVPNPDGYQYSIGGPIFHIGELEIFLTSTSELHRNPFSMLMIMLMMSICLSSTWDGEIVKC